MRRTWPTNLVTNAKRPMVDGLADRARGLHAGVLNRAGQKHYPGNGDLLASVECGEGKAQDASEVFHERQLAGESIRHTYGIYETVWHFSLRYRSASNDREGCSYLRVLATVHNLKNESNQCVMGGCPQGLYSLVNVPLLQISTVRPS